MFRECDESFPHISIWHFWGTKGTNSVMSINCLRLSDLENVNFYSNSVEGQIHKDWIIAHIVNHFRCHQFQRCMAFCKTLVGSESFALLILIGQIFSAFCARIYCQSLTQFNFIESRFPCLVQIFLKALWFKTESSCLQFPLLCKGLSVAPSLV